MTGQLTFTRLLAEADEQRHATLDRHRQCVQTWFDALPVCDKDRLGEWFTISAWDTCAALANAAGDWHQTSPRAKGK